MGVVWQSRLVTYNVTSCEHTQRQTDDWHSADKSVDTVTQSSSPGVTTESQLSSSVFRLRVFLRSSNETPDHVKKISNDKQNIYLL